MSALSWLAIGMTVPPPAGGSGGIQWPLLLMYQVISIGVGLGMYYAVGGFFEYRYYRKRRDDARAWKAQPGRWPSPKNRRSELISGTLNMTLGSMLSGLLVYHVATGGYSSIYFDLGTHGLPFTLFTTAVYFLGTDCGLYWAHRLLHRPRLFKYIHRHHHRYTSPTAFTAMAMHPAEFLLYQSIALAPLFFLPVHAAGVVAVLLYQNYVALIDHSGIRFYPLLPWQPTSVFHDDHHVHFHVNYTQNLGLWDRIFGTWRLEGRRYGIDVFGGKGAPLDGETAVASGGARRQAAGRGTVGRGGTGGGTAGIAAGAPVRRMDYSREATEARCGAAGGKAVGASRGGAGAASALEPAPAAGTRWEAGS